MSVNLNSRKGLKLILAVYTVLTTILMDWLDVLREPLVADHRRALQLGLLL